MEKGACTFCGFKEYREQRIGPDMYWLKCKGCGRMYVYKDGLLVNEYGGEKQLSLEL